MDTKQAVSFPINNRDLTIRQRERKKSGSSMQGYVVLAFPPKLRLRILRARTLTTAIDVNESFFKTMPKFRDTILLAHASRLINAEEFVLLYDLHKPKNPDLPYTNYERFDLDKMTDDECKTEFRFYKNDIYNLADVLTLPDRIVCYNGVNVDMVEALCIFLKRFAYPCRYVDMIPRFGRPEPQLCMISNAVMNELYQTWNRLLTDLNQVWLSPNHLEEFAAAVHTKGAALDNCWGFVDGTVRPICRPGQNQKCLYNGHKKVHAIKFQSIAAPSGLVANLFGPVEGKRHDSGMLARSGVLNQLQRFSVDTNGTPYVFMEIQHIPFAYICKDLFEELD